MADTITSKLGRILGVFACDSISQSVISVRYYGIKHLCCLQSLCPRISEMLANIWPLLESSCTIFSSAHSVRIGLSFLKCLVFFFAPIQNLKVLVRVLAKYIAVLTCNIYSPVLTLILPLASLLIARLTVVCVPNIIIMKHGRLENMGIHYLLVKLLCLIYSLAHS